MNESDQVGDRELVAAAIAAADPIRGLTSPNPWVGAAVRCRQGRLFTGATEPPPGRHAEVVAIEAARAAGADLDGAAMAVTLEPCDHHGRTPPCTEAILAAGIGRVIVGVTDPDPKVAGAGIARLRDAGVNVETVDAVVGAEQRSAIEDQLAPYLHHRRTGRPWVVLKLAATLDGGTAAPDRTSQWITGPEARLDAHRIRARSDAVIVGAGTVRDDDPALTVRLPDDDPLAGREPMRVVLGRTPADARVQPCVEESGPLTGILQRLGTRGVLQVMVEGGAATAAEFHREGLVDHYVVYLAPALFGGDDHRGLMAGSGAATIGDLWRGRIRSVRMLGPDLRIDLIADSALPSPPASTRSASSLERGA